jgi:hypothetical protein
MANIVDLTKKYENYSDVRDFLKRAKLLSAFGPYKKGDVIEFWGGYNDDIRFRAKITGFNKDGDIYLEWDSYWFPIRDEKKRGIKIIKINKSMATKKKTASRKEGVKADGTLKKGFRYAKGGRVVKAKSATAKKRTTKRKTTKK